MTEKQRRFCHEYLLDLNATRAYKAAYPSAKKDTVASAAGARLLAKEEIKSFVDACLKTIEGEKIAEATEVLKYATAVMRGQVEAEVLVTVLTGSGTSIVQKVKKYPDQKDRLKATEMLGRYHSLFTDKVQLESAVPVQIVDDIPLVNDTPVIKRVPPVESVPVPVEVTMVEYPEDDTEDEPEEVADLASSGMSKERARELFWFCRRYEESQRLADLAGEDGEGKHMQDVTLIDSTAKDVGGTLLCRQLLEHVTKGTDYTTLGVTVSTRFFATKKREFYQLLDSRLMSRQW